MEQCFFQFTKDAYTRLSDTFDIIHPITLSFWNQKNQVIDFKKSQPNCKLNDYEEKFNPLDIVTGINYEKVFIQETFDAFKQKLAFILLVNLFAVYEEFFNNLEKEIGIPRKTELKDFENPHHKRKDKTGTYIYDSGFTYIISKYLANFSSPMNDAYQFYLTSNRHHEPTNIDDMLYCFHYFKLVRNKYIHDKAIVTQQIIDAYNLYLLHKNGMGLSKDLEITPPVLNQKITLSLREVIGFSSIIFSLIITIDCELAKTKKAEAYFIKRVKQLNKIIKKFDLDPIKAISEVNSICNQIGFLPPKKPDEIKKLLISNKLIKAPSPYKL